MDSSGNVHTCQSSHLPPPTRPEDNHNLASVSNVSPCLFPQYLVYSKIGPLLSRKSLTRTSVTGIRRYIGVLF